MIDKPGCGKGSVCNALKTEFDVTHLSTGDLLRAEMKLGTLLDETEMQCIRSGRLVNDSTILKLVESGLEKNEKSGFIFDGFPRTVNQAEMLEEVLKKRKEPITKVFELSIDDSILEKRICGRRVHAPSGRVYHVEFNPPLVESIDDITGEPLIQRSDDTPEVLKRRLQDYYESTQPVVQYYKSMGILQSFDVSGDLTDIIQNIRTALRYDESAHESLRPSNEIEMNPTLQQTCLEPVQSTEMTEHQHSKDVTTKNIVFSDMLMDNTTKNDINKGKTSQPKNRKKPKDKKKTGTKGEKKVKLTGAKQPRGKPGSKTKK